MQNPFSGIGHFFSGAGMVFSPGLRRYVFWPLLINILVFIALGVVAWYQFSDLLDWLMSFLPGWLEWLRYLLWPFFWLATALVFYFTFTLVANLIAAPFNSALAAAVERRLQPGNNPEAGQQGVMREALKAFSSELGKLLYFILRAIPIGILFLIPVVQVIAPFAWLAFSAWLLCQEYADYPMANHGIAFRDQHQRLKQRRWTGFSFGTMVLIAGMIPILNLLVMPAAVAGATKMYLQDFAET